MYAHDNVNTPLQFQFSRLWAKFCLPRQCHRLCTHSHHLVARTDTSSPWIFALQINSACGKTLLQVRMLSLPISDSPRVTFAYPLLSPIVTSCLFFPPPTTSLMCSTEYCSFSVLQQFCKTSRYFGGPSASPKGHLYPQMQMPTPPKVRVTLTSE